MVAKQCLSNLRRFGVAVIRKCIGFVEVKFLLRKLIREILGLLKQSLLIVALAEN